MLENPVLDRIVGFFEAKVLNLYTSHPDKYELDTDFFEGVLETTMVNYQNKFTFLLSPGRRTRFPNRAGHNVKVILKSTIIHTSINLNLLKD